MARRLARHPPLIRMVRRQVLEATAIRGLRRVAMANRKVVSAHPINRLNSTAGHQPAADTALHRGNPRTAPHPAATVNRKASAGPPHLTALPAASVHHKIHTVAPARWCP